MTKKKKEKNIVYVGGKPVMSYVTAVIMQFNVEGHKKVLVKSRGKYISRAVDVVEVVRKRFLDEQIELTKIEIGSEEFEGKEGRAIRVSSITLTLRKK